MGLAEYRRKRRFDETPEPPPEAATEDRYRFVVQKHRASHLISISGWKLWRGRRAGVGHRLVAEIKFTEWTHAGENGEIKMRAPVFMGLRSDKPPNECKFDLPHATKFETNKRQANKAA